MIWYFIGLIWGTAIGVLLSKLNERPSKRLQDLTDTEVLLIAIEIRKEMAKRSEKFSLNDKMQNENSPFEEFNGKE